MKKLNCDSLKHIPIDDDLLQKTIAIPETADRTAPVLSLSHRRAAAAAAVFVLVCTVSLLTYIFFGMKPPVNIGNLSVVPTDPIPKRATEAYLPPTQILPTDADRAQVTTAETVSPTNDDNGANGGQSALRPLVTGPYSTEVTAPTRPETEMHTETQISPTQSPASRPEDPSAPTATEPTEAPSQPESNICSAVLNERLMSEKMYCFIADTAANIYGDSDLFSRQHLANIEAHEDGWYTVSYNPDDYGLVTETDIYRYAFYTEEGAIVYLDTVYLSAAQADERGE